MLGIPLKYTEPVDIVTPIRNYLSSKYPKSEVDQYQESLNKLQALRNDVAAIRTINTGARDTLYKYFSQLPSVADKFSINESSGTGLRITLTWTDTLSATKHQQSSWLFEMANVAYNIASVESDLTVNINRDSVETILAAHKGFILAASLLIHVRDNIANRLLGTIPVDLRPEGLTMYSNILLAQAQLCIYERAKMEKMNSATLSKVAGGAVKLFMAAAESLSNPQDKWTAERIYPFHTHCESFAELFNAASFFRYSEVVLQQTTETGVGYGSRVAWLTAAEKACTLAINKPLTAEKNLLSISKGKTIAVSPASISTNAAKELLEQLVPLREEAARDNDHVYREVVPKFSELPPLPTAVLAVATPVPDMRPESRGMVDLFAGMVPVELATSLSTVPDRLTVKANQWKERVTKATDEARSILQSLGLPGAIEANTGNSSNGLPINVADRVNRCQLEGGINELDRLWQVIVKSASFSNDMIRQIEAVLNEELDSDQNLRNRIGEQRYTITKSEIVQVDLRAELNKYISLMQAASSSDQQLYARLEAYRPLLQILSRSRSEIDSTIPNSPTITTGSNYNSPTEALLNVLRTGVKELEILIDARAPLVQKIKETYDKSAVLDILKKASSSMEHGQLLDNYFSKAVTVNETELENNLNSQTRLLEQIKIAYSRWNDVRGLDERTKARDRAIQNVCDSVDKFDEIRSNLREGETFWSELQRSINLLLQNCKDMLAARNMQRKEVLLRLPPMVNNSTNSNGTSTNNDNSGTSTNYGMMGYPSLSGSNNSSSMAVNRSLSGTSMDRSLSNGMPVDRSLSNTIPASWATFDPVTQPPVPSYPPPGTNTSFMFNTGNPNNSNSNNNLIPPNYQPTPINTWNIPSPMNHNNNNNWNTMPSPMAPSPMNNMNTISPMFSNSNNNNNNAPSFDNNSNVRTLMGMGFTREKVERALNMHNGNFDSALNQLLTE